MTVKLVDQFGDIKRVADISSICYGHKEAKNPRKLFRHLIDLGHTSTMEHIVFTFYVEGISRACLSQLTRHRHASYTVESQRYVKYDNDNYGALVPDMPNDTARHKYINAMTDSFEYYKELIELGVKAEDARMVLPTASKSNLYMTINLRSFMNFLKLRLDKSAQWEIRQLAEDMLKEVKDNDNELGGEIERWLHEEVTL